jgi:hypothetical protein
MSGVEGLIEALEFIAEGHDVGRHDGLPEDGPAHDADTMFAVARAALSAIEGGGGALQPSASVPTEQADGGVDREAIAWANNSLFGSHGYFLSFNGEPADPRHLANAIEDLKADHRKAVRLATPPATPIAGGDRWAKIEAAFADAITLADRLIDRGLGTDTPASWPDALRRIAEARAALTQGESRQTGWIDHDGGPNPVPGQQVEDVVWKAEGASAGLTLDNIDWRQVTAYRVVALPAAPTPADGGGE